MNTHLGRMITFSLDVNSCITGWQISFHLESCYPKSFPEATALLTSYPRMVVKDPRRSYTEDENLGGCCLDTPAIQGTKALSPFLALANMVQHYLPP